MFAKRPIWRSALLVVLVLLAVSCRAVPPFPEPPTPDSQASSSEPDYLVLWHSETGAARVELEALARDFQSAYPGLPVIPSYVGTPADLEKQVTAAVALGRTPDLVLAPQADIAQFARLGGLLPLQPFLEDPSLGLKDEDRSDFFAGVLDEGVLADLNRQPYAFPFNLDGLVLFYNADLLRAASFDQPPATWDQFSDIASKVTKEEQYGWAMQIKAPVLAAMLASQGSAMLDRPERRTLFAERGGLAAMTLASTLTKSGAAHVKGSAAEALDDFARGHAAFYLDWMSRLPAVEQAQKRAGTAFEIGMANLPQRDAAEPYMLVSGDDLAIFKIADNRAQRAWFFIRWVTASRQTARWARAAGAIPLRASALTFLLQESQDPGRLKQISSALGNRAPTFLPLPASVHVPQIEALMEDAWSQIVLNKADVAGTLTAASANANQILAGGR